MQANPMREGQTSDTSQTSNDIDLSSEPSSVPLAIWKKLSPEERKIILNDHNKIVAPEGINKKLWDGLSSESKSAILRCYSELPAPRPVYDFFFNWYEVVGDLDSAINSLALIDALLLTIPFSVLTSLSSDFFSTLQENVSSDLYNYAYYVMLSNNACLVYSSMVGLLFAVMYYLFKPPAYMELTERQMLKRRVLVFFCWVATVCAIVGALDTVSLLFQFYSSSYDNLDNSDYTKFTNPGVFFVIFSIFIGFYLAW